MEMLAAIRALEAVNPGDALTIVTDSQLLKRGASTWLRHWKKRGMKRRSGALKNADLWQRISDLCGERAVTWKWVRGHSGNPHNTRADRLAAHGRAVELAKLGGRTISTPDFTQPRPFSLD
jgi:ribonuclease HI